jgi:hypothetical protein
LTPALTVRTAMEQPPRQREGDLRAALDHVTTSPAGGEPCRLEVP